MCSQIFGYSVCFRSFSDVKISFGGPGFEDQTAVLRLPCTSLLLLEHVSRLWLTFLYHKTVELITVTVMLTVRQNVIRTQVTDVGCTYSEIHIYGNHANWRGSNQLWYGYS